MLSKVIAWLGVACLAAGAWFYVQTIRDARLNLQPLSLPISLAPGVIKTPQFTADIDHWDYEIVVDFDPKIDRERMECFLSEEANPERCTGATNSFDISWKLLEGERVVFEGTSKSTPGLVEEPRVRYERMIGKFKAQKGHKYTVLLNVKDDASELNSANPKLVVQILRGYWEDHAVGIALGRVFASILETVGIAILVGIFAFRKFRRRAANA